MSLCTLSSRITSFVVRILVFLRGVRNHLQHSHLELLLKFPIWGPAPKPLSQNLWGGIQEFTFLTSPLGNSYITMKFAKYFNTVTILTNQISSQYLFLKDLNDDLSLPRNVPLYLLFSICSFSNYIKMLLFLPFTFNHMKAQSFFSNLSTQYFQRPFNNLNNLFQWLLSINKFIFLSKM